MAKFCFYRCLSQNLHGTQMRHRVIRDKVVQHMSFNKQKYAPLIDGDIEMHLRLQRFSDGRISSWATEAEIQAAADTYQVNILVATDESFRTWNTFQGDHDLETDTIDANIYLLCKNSHFSLVKKAKNNPGNDDLSLRSIPDWFEPEETELTYPKCVDTHGNMPTKATHSSFHKIKTYKANTDKKDNNLRSGNTQCNAKRKYGCKNEHTYQEPRCSVVNLSKHKLTDAQISVLEKGLKFIPTSGKINKIKLLSDLAEWERRMRLKEFFYDKEGNLNDACNVQTKFQSKQKSYFTPNPGRDAHLDLYIELVKTDIIENLKKKGNFNVTKEEKAAFFELLNNPDIVIRPAYKGSGIVVVDKNEYISELLTEMDRSDIYERTEQKQIEDSYKKIKKLVDKMHKEGVITKEIKQYLMPKYATAGKLKGNPKIHKKDIPYRTIVSGINTPTERIAELVEHELNQYVESSPGYIQDTNDFINKLADLMTEYQKIVFYSALMFASFTHQFLGKRDWLHAKKL